MIENKKYVFLSFLSLALLSGCSSDGGNGVQEKVSGQNDVASQRASDARAQMAQNEATDRLADANKIARYTANGGQMSTIRTGGVARASSLEGNSASTTTPSPTVGAKDDSSQAGLMMLGLSVFALFGKDIVEGGSSAIKEASKGLGGLLSNDKDKAKESVANSKSNESSGKKEEPAVQDDTLKLGGDNKKSTLEIGSKGSGVTLVKEDKSAPKLVLGNEQKLPGNTSNAVCIKQPSSAEELKQDFKKIFEQFKTQGRTI